MRNEQNKKDTCRGHVFRHIEPSPLAATAYETVVKLILLLLKL